MNVQLILLGLVCLCTLTVATGRVASHRAAGHHRDLQDEWSHFIARQKRSYHSTHETTKRYNIFAKNMQKVRQHQLAYKTGNVTFDVHLNCFADMTSEEMA